MERLRVTIFHRTATFYRRGLVACLAAFALIFLLLTGLAVAADAPRLETGTAYIVRPLLPSQSITPTSSILPDGFAIDPIPVVPPISTVEVPDWVADLMQRGGQRGISNGEVVVETAVSAGLGSDGQAVNGDFITYIITVTNNTSDTIRDIILLDVLPRGALQEIGCINDVTCKKITEDQTFAEPLGGTITVTETRQISWTIASIPPSTSAAPQPEVRQFRGRLVGQTDGSIIKNQAFASYGQGGPPKAVSSNETQTIVRVSAAVGVGATLARAATWFSNDLGGTLSLDWGDFDRDGDLDMALGSSLGTTIYRNENGRLRAFWSNSRRTYGVSWGDFLGNGALALLAVGDESNGEGLNYLYTIEGTTVQESSRFTSTHPFVRSAPGDYDKDGDLDLILSTNAINAPCPVQFYRNNGGVFTRPSDDNGGCVSTRATAALAPGDVDNDGDLDLALGLFPNAVQLFINDGSGKFPQALRQAIDTSAGFLPYHFAWGDYDGDGFLDLAAAYPLLRQARIYHNATGTSATTAFTSTAFTLRTDRFLTPFSLDWGDFTGDGLLDLAVANVSPVVFKQTSSGFVSQPQLSADAVIGQIWSLRGVDVDRDGDLDLAVTNQKGPSLVFTNFAPVLKSKLTPVPFTDAVIATSRATAPSAAVAWGDINADGLSDLIFGAGPPEANNPTALSTKVYPNTQSVFNGADEATIGGFGPHVLAVGDVNNDNALDLAVGTSLGTSLYLAGALGTAAWTSSTPFFNVSALAWGDSDDDRDLDLLVANADGPLQLYRNQQKENGGLLTAAPVFTSTESGDNSQAVAWADLNGDSFLDFVVGNDGHPNRIYINQRGLGDDVDSFIPMEWPVITSTTRAVAWGDYDGDGDQDLAVGNYGESNRIYENQGIFNGLPLISATPIWASTETSKTTSLAWGDWDNDGDLDLAVGNDGEADQIYVNRRDPIAPTNSVQLAWVWSSDATQRTTGVAWGDVDSDGDLDLAVSQAGGSATSINGYYENTTIVAAHLVDVYRSAIPLQINPAYLSLGRPGGEGPGGLYAVPGILSGPSHPTVTVPFRLYDPDGPDGPGGIRNVAGSNGFGTPIPVGQLLYEYSLDDGGRWLKATGVLSNSTIVSSQPTPSNFDGTGDSDRAIFLPAGTVKFEIKHDGQNTFTVWLLDSENKLAQLLAEKVGAFDGIMEVDIPADGSYTLQIRGDGKWTIKVESSTSTSGSAVLDTVTPTRLGQDYAFVWDAQADKAISENARFRISLVQGNNVGPVKKGSTAAVSPPFRVRGTTCVWPQGASFRKNKESINALESVEFIGTLLEGTGVMKFTWDFGDGSALVSGQRINHTYSYGGVFTVKVTATGVPCPIGRSVSMTGTVTVIGGQPPLFLPLVSSRGSSSRAGDTARLLPKPGSVDGLMGEAEGSGLRLHWRLPSTGGPVDSYRIYASRADGEFQPIGTAAGDRPSFFVAGQSCGTAYLVTGVGPGGEGPDSLQSYLAPACGGDERGGRQ